MISSQTYIYSQQHRLTSKKEKEKKMCPLVLRGSSKCPQCSADVSALISQCDEYRLLGEEKDRLFELVNILQTK